MLSGTMSIRWSSKASSLRNRAFLAGLFALASLHAHADGVTLPPVGAQYDSQLGGAYTPPAGVAIVSRDRADAPIPGLYNICYINAFQTQPQELDMWQQVAPELLLKDAAGALFNDPLWPNEVLLDTRTSEARDWLFEIVAPWIAQCAKDGFQAIEADNIDTYARSNGALRLADNLAYAVDLANYAHSLGLAFAQKNGSEIGPSGKAAGFDFAIVESCQVYDECDYYTALFGGHVLEIEYTDTAARFFDTACAARGAQISVIRRDRNLTMSNDPSYFYETC